MDAVIKRKTSNTMQSGKVLPSWEIYFINDKPTYKADVDSWLSGGNTQAETRISFKTKEDAINFAKKHGYNYHVIDPIKQKPLKPKSYVDTITKNPNI